MSGFTFAITPYEGHEKDVLLLLNRNRSKPKDQRYLDWRYTCQDSPFPPVIFWALHAGRPIGMAGIVFRPYLINGKGHHVGVLGDIALEEEYRGTGIAQRFFHFINEYLKEHGHHLTFVLPNQVAEKALLQGGWRTVDAIYSFVFLLNPEEKIAARLKAGWVAKTLGLGYRFLNSFRMRTWRKKGFSMKLLADFDDSASLLWQAIPKEGIIFRDRSAQALRARYLAHPDRDQFQICLFSRNEHSVGMVVYTLSDDMFQCHIYELILSDNRAIRPVLASFGQHILGEFPVTSIRLNMNAGHPYAPTLRKMGFFQREKIQALQVLEDKNSRIADTVAWFMTAGDKDV